MRIAMTKRGGWAVPFAGLLAMGCPDGPGDPAAGDVPDTPDQADRGEPSEVDIPVTNASDTAEDFFTNEQPMSLCVDQSQPSFDSQGNALLFAPDDRANGDPFDVYWSVCNNGTTGSGPTYQLVVELEQLDENSPTGFSRTPHTTLDIVTPTIEHCKCYFQVVGANKAPNAETATQPFVTGAVYPQLDPPLQLQPDAQNYQYIFRLENAPFQTMETFGDEGIAFTAAE